MRNLKTQLAIISLLCSFTQISAIGAEPKGPPDRSDIVEVETIPPFNVRYPHYEHMFIPSNPDDLFKSKPYGPDDTGPEISEPEYPGLP